MARASTPTLLSLDRWAKIMGLNPVHFNGAAGDIVWPDEGHACKDIWPQWSWQSPDIISREELARQIRLSEMSVARALGYHPAPTWVAEEEHDFPRFHNIGWEQPHSLPRSINTKYRHVIAGGRRAVSIIELSAPIVFSDEDGDGFYETGTVTITGVTDLLDVKEARIFFTGKDGNPAWEIRPVRTRLLEDDELTITFDSWLAINPALWEKQPTSMAIETINITTTTNFVAAVDVYRVYNSSVEASAMFYNSNGYYCQVCGNNGCENCAQEGCLRVENGTYGKVVAAYASWDDENEVWVGATCRPWINAQTMKVWYYGGLRSEQYKAGYTDDPMDDLLAEAIAMLTTARLSKPVCSCSNVRLMADDLRRDLAFSDKNHFNLIWRDSTVQTNPFGSKAGEVRAWKIVNELIGDAVIGGTM